MIIDICPGWPDYKLLDCGSGRKLEKFGHVILDRPDPQAVWRKTLPESEWRKAGAIYIQKTSGTGEWTEVKISHPWTISVSGLTFKLNLTPFKHTGIFPEQYNQWEMIADKIKSSSRQVRVLNLFAYTGVATAVALNSGAAVVHVDSSNSANRWAQENLRLNGLEDKSVRFITEDVIKFVEREIRRNHKYDIILLDPPAYGHGPKGEVWDFNRDMAYLMESIAELLSEKPIMILINAYAVSVSHIMLTNLLTDITRGLSGQITGGELVLAQDGHKRLLSTGIFGCFTGS